MKKLLLYALLVFAGLALLSAAFFGIRQWLAHAQIEREALVTPAPVSDLQSTTTLEILPLYENARTADNLELGHGVSYLIRTEFEHRPHGPWG